MKNAEIFELFKVLLATGQGPSLDQTRRLVGVLETQDAEIERLRAVGAALVRYGDDHNWGLIPEGETIENARKAFMSR